MQHIIEHDLSPELAKRAAEEASAHYSKKWQKYNAKATWTSDTHANIDFRVKGIHVAATIDLQPGRVVIDMKDVPLLLRPFKNMALEVVQSTMQKWITKAKNGELDG